jgi:hypothetical protein
VRNATDDFNPFHDPQRWQNIEQNPFGDPIELGFQAVALALDKVSSYRREHGEEHLADENGLHFHDYKFTFAGALVPGSELTVQVRKTANNIAKKGELSNR